MRISSLGAGRGLQIGNGAVAALLLCLSCSFQGRDNLTGGSVGEGLDGGGTCTDGDCSPLAAEASAPPPQDPVLDASTGGRDASRPTACDTQKLTVAGVSASSVEMESTPAELAVNGVVDAICIGEDRWSSDFSDPQWLQVDLGQSQSIREMRLYWECARSAHYEIQVADSLEEPWQTVYEQLGLPDHALTPGGVGSTDVVCDVGRTARYVRVFSHARNSEWGISLYEVELFGGPPGCSFEDGTCDATPNTAPPDAGADAGSPAVDAGPGSVDSGVLLDSGTTLDSGAALDASSSDAG